MIAEVLAPAVWRARAAAHEARVDAFTAGHRARRQDGRRHPVEDFLFTYYSYRPARLRRWHPGVGVALDAAAGSDRAAWRFHRTDGDRVVLDVDAFLDRRADTVRFVRRLLEATAARPARLDCFGLHEWAMVYRAPAEDVRHAGWPLRLGPQGTDEVVEGHRLRCTHYDAFRFYADAARPRNEHRPTVGSRVDLEQPGCLHAGMDVYKWAFKLAPAVPGELVADAFALARDIRELDMRASPYDLRELGYEPVAIETPAGRAEYVAGQRRFGERAQVLRGRVVEVCDVLLQRAGAPARTSP